MEQINQQIKDLQNQNLQSENDVISKEYLMKWLDISSTTIHRWRERGILKAYFLGKKMFFKKSEILASLEAIS